MGSQPSYDSENDSELSGEAPGDGGVYEPSEESVESVDAVSLPSEE